MASYFFTPKTSIGIQDATQKTTNFTASGSSNLNTLSVSGDVSFTSTTQLSPSSNTISGVEGAFNVSGDILFANATKNTLYFKGVGLSAPTFTTRSPGSKFVLFPNLSASTTDYAIGLETGNLWFSTPSASTGFKWYAGTTSIGNMDGGGNMTVTGFISCNRVAVSNPTPTASSHLTSKLYVDGLGYLTAGTGLTKTGSTLSVNASQTQITDVGTLNSLSVGGILSTTTGNITINAFSRLDPGTSEVYSLTASSRNTFAPAGTVAKLVSDSNSIDGATLLDFSAPNAANGATGVYIGAVCGAGANSPANFVIGRRTGVSSWAESLRVNANTTVSIWSTQDSSSSTTGAVMVSGGLGVAKNLFVGQNISCLDPTISTHAATKNYVDGLTYLTAGTGLTKTGGTLSVNAAQTQITSVGTLTSLNVSGPSVFSGSVTVPTPSATTDATNKAYVDGLAFITAGTGLTKTGSTLSVNAAQPQITSVGTLTSLALNGSIVSAMSAAPTGTTYNSMSLLTSGYGLIISGGLTQSVGPVAKLDLKNNTTQITAVSFDGSGNAAFTGTVTGTSFGGNLIGGTVSGTTGTFTGAVTGTSFGGNLVGGTLTATTGTFSSDISVTGALSSGALTATTGIFNGNVNINGFSRLDPGTTETYSLTASSRTAFSPSGTVLKLMSDPNGVNGATLVDFSVPNSSNGNTGAYIGAIAGNTGNGPAAFVIGYRSAATSWTESVRVNSVNATVNVWSPQDSSSSTTGALMVGGGVGIAKNLYVGGNLIGGTVSGTTGTFTGALSGTSFTGNLIGGTLTATTGSFSGAVTVPTPSATTHATTKAYVDGLTYLTAGTGLTLTGGTLSVNAAQTQITSVGTLSSLTVSGPLYTSDRLGVGGGTTETYSLTSSSKAMYEPAGTVANLTSMYNNVNGSTLLNISASNSNNGTSAVFVGAVAGNSNGAAHFVIGRRTGTTSWAESLRVDKEGTLLFSTSEISAPTYTTRSVGTKLVLSSNIGASTVDYAIGTETNNVWFSTTSASTGFKWYAGTSSVMTLSGAGTLGLTSGITATTGTLTDTTDSSSSTSGALVTNGGVGIAKNLYVNGMGSRFGLNVGNFTATAPVEIGCNAVYAGNQLATGLRVSNTGSASNNVSSTSNVSYNYVDLRLGSTGAGGFFGALSVGSGSTIVDALKIFIPSGSASFSGGVTGPSFSGNLIGGTLTATTGSFSGAVTVPTPSATTDATNKAYVDGLTFITAGTGLTKTGGTLSVNAAQTQITSIGTLSSLTITGALSSGALTATTGTFSGISNVSNVTKLSTSSNTVSSSTGSSTIAGDLHLYHATNPQIVFGAGSTTAPSFTTRSAGTRLVLYPGVTASTTDYAIGMEPSNIWFSTTSTTTGFRWYGGTTLAAALTGGGSLTLTAGLSATTGTFTSTAASSSVTTGALTVAGGAGVGGNLYVANLISSSTIATGAISGTTGNFGGDISTDTNLIVNGVTESTGVGIGAVVVLGGMSVAKRLRTNGGLVVNSGGLTVTAGGVNVTGVSTFNNTTTFFAIVCNNSLSVTGTGSFSGTVTGSSFSGNLIGGTVSGTTGAFTGVVSIANTTDATSASSASLTSTGGGGFAGSVHVAGMTSRFGRNVNNLLATAPMEIGCDAQFANNQLVTGLRLSNTGSVVNNVTTTSGNPYRCVDIRLGSTNSGGFYGALSTGIGQTISDCITFSTSSTTIAGATTITSTNDATSGGVAALVSSGGLWVSKRTYLGGPLLITNSAKASTGTSVGNTVDCAAGGSVVDGTTAASTTNSTIQRTYSLMGGQSFQASNASVTYSTAATCFVGVPPVAGTNVTITAPYSLYVDGSTYINGPVTGTSFVGTATSASRVEFADTRASNPLPSFYFGKGIVLELKDPASFTFPISNQFIAVLTLHVWVDSTIPVFQLGFYVTGIKFRASTGASTWSAWSSITLT